MRLFFRKKITIVLLVLFLVFGFSQVCYADYIKWIEFNVPLSLMKKAYDADVASYKKETPLDWVELLAYTAAKNWGEFPSWKKTSADMDKLIARLNSGEKLADITADMKLYPFYKEAYTAVLGNFVGEYEIEKTGGSGGLEFEKTYGLRVFSPVAKGYGFSHFDDFGNSRSYGYKRRHQGNDLFGNVGTPIIAVEDGYVEALGWNQYGGWRVGIRSHDKKRYYYYAHLKKDHPYVNSLKQGDVVSAGDVIGYMGMSGYSANENVNNINVPHLHFGMQIIFDESQKDGVNQIWIDMYNIVEFLNKNRMSVQKKSETDEMERTYRTNSIAEE